MLLRGLAGKMTEMFTRACQQQYAASNVLEVYNESTVKMFRARSSTERLLCVLRNGAPYLIRVASQVVVSDEAGHKFAVQVVVGCVDIASAPERVVVRILAETERSHCLNSKCNKVLSKLGAAAVVIMAKRLPQLLLRNSCTDDDDTQVTSS